MSINVLQVIHGNITVPGLDLEAELCPGIGTGMSSTKELTSSLLGTLYNYVWTDKEGIHLGPSYANRGELSHEWYSASNMEKCLQQCDITIAAGGVYLLDADKRREEN